MEQVIVLQAPNLKKMNEKLIFLFVFVHQHHQINQNFKVKIVVIFLMGTTKNNELFHFISKII